MPAAVLSGTEAAEALLAPLAERARAALTRRPRLVAIRANNDPGTAWYAGAQAKHCAAHNIEHVVRIFNPATVTRDELLAEIARQNADPHTDGILLFTPLPRGIDAARLSAAIAPEKDAEGVHPVNLGRLALEGVDADSFGGEPKPDAFPMPCTAMAAVALIRRAAPSLAGVRTLVIGRSAIVGKPAALMLLGLHATVTIGHTRTHDLAALARQSDVVLAAAGAAGAVWRRYRPEFERARAEGRPPPPPPDWTPLVKEDWIKRGAVVVDVGENEVPAQWDETKDSPVMEPDGSVKTKRVGDVERKGVEDIAGWLTPEKGGVGPLTNAYLLRNVLLRACAQVRK